MDKIVYKDVWTEAFIKIREWHSEKDNPKFDVAFNGSELKGDIYISVRPTTKDEEREIALKIANIVSEYGV